MEGTMILAIEVNEQSMMVHDHHVVHTIHLCRFVEPWTMGIIVQRLVDFDANVINEFNKTLEFGDVHF